jgi:hypothetical protein
VRENDIQVAASTVDNGDRIPAAGTSVTNRRPSAANIAIALEPVRSTFDLRLPRRPHATDDFECGAFRRPLEEALSKRYIEFNPFGRVAWLLFDIDRDEAFDAAEDAGLPPPNILMQNRHNGRGHLAYALASPVGTIGNSRPAPVRFAADVQRGMTLRLRADPHFLNRFSKNPMHADWRTSWLATSAYELSEIRGWLDDSDVWRPKGVEHAQGLGRNCDLFDAVRIYAYRKVGEYREMGRIEPWHQHLRIIAAQQNQSFVTPLSISEVRSVAKSVAKWTWTKFGGPGFNKKQAERGKRGAEKRWEGHESLAYRRPWDDQGVSRATYFRNLAKAKDKCAQADSPADNSSAQ